MFPSKTEGILLGGAIKRNDPEELYPIAMDFYENSGYFSSNEHSRDEIDEFNSLRKLAFELFQKLAEDGYAPAKGAWGERHFSDSVYLKEFLKVSEKEGEEGYCLDEGLRWLESAAKDGDLPSQLYLAKVHHEKKGPFCDGYAPDQDLAEASRWFMEAVKQGNVGAREKLRGIHAELSEKVNQGLAGKFNKMGIGNIKKAEKLLGRVYNFLLENKQNVDMTASSELDPAADRAVA